jgi:diguanylate cyclase (GGDEF)-like protein
MRGFHAIPALKLSGGIGPGLAGMAKRSLSKPVGTGRAREVRGALRREAAAGRSMDEAAPPAAPAAADLRRLAAEVARLEGELAAARAHLHELEAQAEVDPLTGVLNRRGFDRELKRAVAYVARYGGSAALVYLDLDRFKPVNDRHGHAAGDAVLKGIAATLLSRVRASDSVARIGGDEFAVLLWNLDERNAIAKACALEAAIAAVATSFGAETLSVGASAGVAMLATAESAPEVLSRADAAMYARKRARRG